MFGDDEEEPKEWEIREEVPSEKLRHKWAQEDWEGAPPVVCPACQKTLQASVLTCLFCGAEVPHGKSGFLMKILAWLKGIFKL